MTDKQPMQADGDAVRNPDDGTDAKPGNGESAGGAYPHPRKPGHFDGGQSEQGYEGPDNPNATTE